MLILIAAAASACLAAPATAATTLCATSTAFAFPPIAGGWRAVESDDEAVQAAAAFAAEQLGSEPSGVESAEAQVVAGINYRFTLTLSDGRKFNVTVFRALDRSYRLVSSEEVGDTGDNESSES